MHRAMLCSLWQMSQLLELPHQRVGVPMMHMVWKGDHLMLDMHTQHDDHAQAGQGLP